jgi:hypothetical protein
MHGEACESDNGSQYPLRNASERLHGYLLVPSATCTGLRAKSLIRLPFILRNRLNRRPPRQRGNGMAAVERFTPHGTTHDRFVGRLS